MTTTVAKDQYSPAQENDRLALEQEKGQYTLGQILGIWLAAGAPMWVLGWLVYPALSQNLSAVDAGLLRIKLFTVGLIWQFVLSMLILYREEGNIRIETIRRRFWLNNPVSPKTGQKNNRLWWLIVPFILLMVAIELVASPFFNGMWTKLFHSSQSPRVTARQPCSHLNCGLFGSAHGIYLYFKPCYRYSTRSWEKNSCSAVYYYPG